MRSKRHPKVERQCVTCDKPFTIHHYKLARGEGKYCSTQCQHKGLEQSVEERFSSNVHKTNNCWIWTGYKTMSGYGSISINKKPFGAHRMSWMINCGPIPEGLWVLHKCDNPPCVNPAHLFLGTQMDNMMDKIKKGRQNRPGCTAKTPLRGDSHPRSKLTEEQVKEIRNMANMKVPQHRIASTFGVCRDTIMKVVNRKLWAHIS